MAERPHDRHLGAPLPRRTGTDLRRGRRECGLTDCTVPELETFRAYADGRGQTRELDGLDDPFVDAPVARN
ncbi:hypothetical protein I7X12_06085 [Halosimplex litoreum]|uniref:Uncharacterized protein n=1 Tax=Halosimplex litoreum TaxID=1198301 RepID=A0A7T3G0M8_9EURY|nr:hypothetical protein [Halosimplex litoreum]QPV64190.1 hypothetical protein I7X12_06085 [Halosimplex litoreum]